MSHKVFGDVSVFCQKDRGGNVEGIRARADVFDEQILRHILSFVPGSSELAAQYSLQPETGHYLVKAGWPVVLKKMCHWKEADTTICICCGANQEPGDPNESDDSWTSQQVSAGWAKVMTVTIPHFRHHHMKYIKKTVRSIEHVWRTMAAERCYICGHCNDCVVNLEYEHPADWLEDLSAFTEMLELRSCPWRCPDKDRPQ